tara:strand:- start:1113 stop:2798 length:1686 start_codon:yes stop_codon:yes gene_type:complete
MFFDIFVKGFLEEFKYTLLFYILLIVIFFPFEAVVLPQIYGNIFDTIKGNIPNVSIFNWYENIKIQNFQGALVSVMIAWTIITLSFGVKHHLESILVPEFMSHIRKQLYEMTMNAFKENYSDVKTGEYLSRMLELMRSAKDLFHYIINMFFPYMIATFVVVLYMFTQNSKIGYTLLFSFVLILILNYFMGNYLIDIVAERENYMNSDVNQNIQNTVDNLMNIYINNETNEEVNKNNEKEKKATNMMENIMFWENVTITTSHLIIALAYVISLYFVYELLINKKIKSAMAIVIILLLGEYVSYGMDLTSGYIHTMIYKLGIIDAAAPYIKELIIDNKDKKKKKSIKNGEINFKDIVFRYKKDSDEVLFDGLNLNIKGGTKCGIMGRSGSGKTTLMKMLIGLYKPEEGQIIIDGVNINKMDVDYLRTEVNYINQNTKLFEDTIIYNMQYGNDISEKEVVEKLKKYNLLQVFSDLPGDIHANAGLNGGNLSGGMQKVTILMRGLFKPGKIIILDEPLAGLDKNTISNVINMIMHETKGKTLLVITHDNTILPYMDEVVNINELH